jgi:hypothetical protein
MVENTMHEGSDQEKARAEAFSMLLQNGSLMQMHQQQMQV